jgi:histone H3/H4
MEITRPSLTRLARRAGIKSVSEDCYKNVRALITQRLDLVLRSALVINAEHATKTLMPEDVYEALALMGENLAQSHELGTTTVSK